MKKVITIILISFLLLMVFGAAASETLEELTAHRDELLSELAQVNAARGKLLKEQGEAVADGNLGKIKDLFPDEVLACIIRDECAKFSIEQTVTAEELEKITWLDVESGASHGLVTDLTGIGYLTNLKTIYGYRSGIEYLPDEMQNCVYLETLSIWYCNLKALPDWIGNLQSLDYINIAHTDVSILPESICDLVNLKILSAWDTKLTALPEGIGNLINLEELSIGNTSVSALPESIGNLSNLKELDIHNTKITSLPESIYNLHLEELNMGGTSIK